MQHDDLPLFAWRPPTAMIIPFPAGKRLGKVRSAAKSLAGKSGRPLEAAWSRIVTDLDRQMRRAGLSDPVIRSEIEAFSDAVSAELWRRNGQRADPGRDGAA